MPELAKAARRDPAVFAQFVLRNEETGKPIRLAPMHVDWHDRLTEHKRVVIWSHTEAGKTMQISVGRVLYEIGKNPNIRILVVSDTAERAKKIVKALKGYIETSPEFRAVFPEVVPDKSLTTGMWRSDAFNVKRTTLAKDPTVQVVGFEGSILGARADLILIDDYLTPETTYSEHMREKGHAWLKGVIEGRRTKDGRLWFIGNAWHHDDAMHRYAKERRTKAERYPVRNARGESSWPEVWSQDRIDEELENRGPIEGPRTLLCQTITDEDRRFKQSYIERALRQGDGHQLYYSLEIVPEGWRTVTGVDLAVSKKNAGGETSILTIAVENRTGRRRIIGLEAGRWGGPEIVERIISAQHRYNSIVIVESNAAQAYIRQFVVDRSAVPVKALYTGANKGDPAFGLESIATEMSQGKWEIPNVGGQLVGGTFDPEIQKLINEMIAYDPKQHTGDRLMSMWFAREGIRMTAAPAGTVKRRKR